VENEKIERVFPNTVCTKIIWIVDVEVALKNTVK
jgi:hypothetical protein